MLGTTQCSNGAWWTAENCFKYCNDSTLSDTGNRHQAYKLLATATSLNVRKTDDIEWYKNRENFIDVEIDYDVDQSHQDLCKSKNSIIEVQERLADILKEYFDVEDDSYISELFLNGGCYAYATILMNILQRGHIVHDYTQGHCALEVDGVCYDITGSIGKGSKYDFRVMSEEDHLYCLENYGFDADGPEEMKKFVADITELYKSSVVS